MAHQQVRQRLMEAAEAGDISRLYGCIQDYPKILVSIDETPFVDTPLHIAASAGHAHFALEMMRLMPSFGRKLNPQGLSPLGLALQSRERLSPSQDLDLRNRITLTISRLINFDKELIRVKGRESFTPLHYVAEKGDIDLLAEFLYACPESIMDRTIRDETALHIALKNSEPQAFKVLLGCLHRIQKHDHVLGWKDDEGNTLLHIAVSTSQTQIVKFLLDKVINRDKNVKNLEGQTALDIAIDIAIVNPDEAGRDIMKALDHAGASKSTSLPEDYSFAEFLMSPQRLFEVFIRCLFYQRTALTMETRNAMLVVAILIATATFQAILSPPGGIVRGTGNATIMSTTNNNLIPTNNVSNTNATIFTNTTTTTTTNPTASVDPSKQDLFKKIKLTAPVTDGSFFIIFYRLNTICFLASIMAITFLLPLQYCSFILYTSLFFLMLTYGLSFFAITPSHLRATQFFILSYGFSSFVYIVAAVNMIGKGATLVLIFMSGQQRKRLQMLQQLLERS